MWPVQQPRFHRTGTEHGGHHEWKSGENSSRLRRQRRRIQMAIAFGTSNVIPVGEPMTLEETMKAIQNGYVTAQVLEPMYREKAGISKPIQERKHVGIVTVNETYAFELVSSMDNSNYERHEEHVSGGLPHYHLYDYKKIHVWLYYE